MPEWKEEIRQRLASLKLAPPREAEIVEELSQHLKDYYAEFRAGGATPEEALRVALAELGASESLARELQREELVAQLKALPGVQAVIPGYSLFRGRGGITLPEVETTGRQGDNGCEVAPGFFAVAGIPLLRGREFTEEALRYD